MQLSYQTLPEFTPSEISDLESIAKRHPELWIESSYACTGVGDRLLPVVVTTDFDEETPAYAIVRPEATLVEIVANLKVAALYMLGQIPE